MGLRKIDLENGWHLTMCDQFGLFVAPGQKIIVDEDGDIGALIDFKEDEVQFLKLGWGMNPKINIKEKHIIFDRIPEEDE